MTRARGTLVVRMRGGRSFDSNTSKGRSRPPRPVDRMVVDDATRDQLEPRLVASQGDASPDPRDAAGDEVRAPSRLIIPSARCDRANGRGRWGHPSIAVGPQWKPAPDYLDDGPEKPIRIWRRTGRRQLLAAGNT